MPFVEGRGMVAPAPVPIHIGDESMRRLVAEAERRAAHRSYGRRGDSWGRGLLPAGGGMSQAAVPILMGFVGEQAFADYVDQQAGTRIGGPDTSLTDFGDGGRDFEIYGVAYQLKTRKRLDGRNLVRRVSDKGRLKRMMDGRYVFAQWDGQACQLLGWCNHSEVRDCKVEKAGHGHWNLVVPAELLKPMCRLIDAIKSDRIEQGA